MIIVKNFVEQSNEYNNDNSENKIYLIITGMRQFSPAQIAFMTRKEKRNDKRKKSKGGKIIKKLDISEGDINGGGGFEEDEGPSSIMYLLDKTVGTVDYLLHRQCAFAADNGGLFSAPPTPISSDHYMVGIFMILIYIYIYLDTTFISSQK
jgi:hypothetical protein